MIYHNMNGEWVLLFIIFFSVKVLYVDSSCALLPPSYRHTLNYGFELNSKKLYPSFLLFLKQRFLEVFSDQEADTVLVRQPVQEPHFSLWGQ